MWWAPTSMTKNHDRKWLFILGGPETSCMTFFGPSMTEKTMVEARAENIGEFPVTVGGWGPSDARCVILSYTYACVCEALGSS